MAEKFDILEEIKQVEAPAFLFTHIQQRITSNNAISMKYVYGIAASLLLLLCLNIFAIKQNTKKEAGNIAINRNLITDNNLYNE